MKKLILITLVISFISCDKKKDKEWTCTCNIHGSSASIVTKEIITDSKNDADSQCSEYGKTETQAAGAHHFECKVQ